MTFGTTLVIGDDSKECFTSVFRVKQSKKIASSLKMVLIGRTETSINN